jgi:hypothetical protein
MHVIFHTADDNRLAFEIRQDAAKIFVQFVTQRFVAQKRPTIFGGEHSVNEDFPERLRHARDNA